MKRHRKILLRQSHGDRPPQTARSPRHQCASLIQSFAPIALALSFIALMGPGIKRRSKATARFALT
jgi:hypothetical protein